MKNETMLFIANGHSKEESKYLLSYIDKMEKNRINNYWLDLREGNYEDNTKDQIVAYHIVNGGITEIWSRTKEGRYKKVAVDPDTNTPFEKQVFKLSPYDSAAYGKTIHRTRWDNLEL